MNNVLTASALRDDALLEEIREALETWDGADPALLASTIEWITTIRDRFADLISTVDDPTDCEMTTAVKYIELKSQWIGFNTQINYQVFRTGACDPILAFRATACSSLLGRLEELLDPAAIQQITEFLAEPVRKVA